MLCLLSESKLNRNLKLDRNNALLAVHWRPRSNLQVTIRVTINWRSDIFRHSHSLHGNQSVFWCLKTESYKNTSFHAVSFSIFPHVSMTPPIGPGPPQYRGFTITLRHTSARVMSLTQRPLTDKTQNSQETPMPLVGFDPIYHQASVRRPTT